MNFQPRPPPLQTRVIAAAIDGAVLVAMMAFSFVLPLLAYGFALPMWGVLLVVVGYAVLPLTLFETTLGLKLMGLQLVNRHGRALDPINAAFRELVGRGFFPAAYLFTLVAGLVAMRFGLGGTIAPRALTGVMTLACGAALVVAMMSPVVALGRPDQRTLADLLAGSFVVLAPARPAPTDEDELEVARATRRRNALVFVALEVLLLGALVAMPRVLTAKTEETTSEKIDRLRLEKLRHAFAAHPEDTALARELQDALVQAGLEDERRTMNQQHVDALMKKEGERELRLRDQFAKSRSRDDAKALISLYEDEDRIDDAEAVYVDFLGTTPEASQLVGFAHWLATWNRNDRAVAVATRAVELDPHVPLGHTVLGVALERVGRLTQAKAALQQALEEDPEDEDAADALERLTRR